MSVPTDDNIRECATIRIKAIEAKDGDLDWVVERAIHYASRRTHAAPTSQAAVSWALADLP